MLNSRFSLQHKGEEENISPALESAKVDSKQSPIYDSDLIAFFNENGKFLEVWKLPEGYIGDPIINELKTKINQLGL